MGKTIDKAHPFEHAETTDPFAEVTGLEVLLERPGLTGIYHLTAKGRRAIRTVDHENENHNEIVSLWTSETQKKTANLNRYDECMLVFARDLYHQIRGDTSAVWSTKELMMGLVQMEVDFGEQRLAKARTDHGVQSDYANDEAILLDEAKGRLKDARIAANILDKVCFFCTDCAHVTDDRGPAPEEAVLYGAVHFTNSRRAVAEAIFSGFIDLGTASSWQEWDVVHSATTPDLYRREVTLNGHAPFEGSPSWFEISFFPETACVRSVTYPSVNA